MSRYFYYKAEPFEEELKEWLATNFDLSEVHQPQMRYRVLQDTIIPAFQTYLTSLKKSTFDKLVENGFITPPNIVTKPGMVYLLYLAD